MSNPLGAILPPVISWAMDNPLKESSFAVERARRFHDFWQRSPWNGSHHEASYKAAWEAWLHKTSQTRLHDWWRVPPSMRAEWRMIANVVEMISIEHEALDLADTAPVDITPEEVAMATRIARALLAQRKHLLRLKAAQDRPGAREALAALESAA